MTRNGKIARLPVFIRNQLNERLQNGEESKELVRWLNENGQHAVPLKTNYGDEEEKEMVSS